MGVGCKKLTGEFKSFMIKNTREEFSKTSRETATDEKSDKKSKKSDKE